MNVENSAGDNALNSLKAVSANVVTLRSSNNTCSVNFAGQADSYTPQWQTTIERPNDHQLFRGAIMIARSPLSGTVHTYFYNQGDQTFDVQQFIKQMNQNTISQSCEFAKLEQYRPASNDALLYGALGDFGPSRNNPLQMELRNPKMQNNQDLTFCLASEDLPLAPKNRRPIRIHADGSNSSAVELVNIDGTDNLCE